MVFFIRVKYFEKKNPEKEFNMADHNFNTNETVATVIPLWFCKYSDCILQSDVDVITDFSFHIFMEIFHKNLLIFDQLPGRIGEFFHRAKRNAYV